MKTKQSSAHLIQLQKRQAGVAGFAVPTRNDGTQNRATRRRMAAIQRAASGCVGDAFTYQLPEGAK